jgi:hypothetical protein
MSTLTLPFPSGRGTGRSGGFMRFLSDLADGIRDGLALAARYDRLSRMSDAELARLGLSRIELPHAALSGRRR